MKNRIKKEPFASGDPPPIEFKNFAESESDNLWTSERKAAAAVVL
jgi:hypothetical protein